MSKTIVILGDDSVGKTVMGFCYWRGKWQRNEDGDPMDFASYIPRVGKPNEFAGTMPDGRHLELLDTSKKEEYGSFISVTYPKADAFIIAYDVSKCVEMRFLGIGNLYPPYSKLHVLNGFHLGLNHWST